MKNIIILLFTLASFTMNAQSDSTNNKMDTIVNKVDTTESTEIDFGNVKIIIKDKNKKVITEDESWKKDSANFDYDNEKGESDYPKVRFTSTFGIGVTGLTPTNSGGWIPPSGVTSGLLYVNTSLELDYSKCRSYMINGNLIFDLHKKFGILTGLGIEFNRYVFKESIEVTPEGSFLKDTITNFSSYKFKTNYLQIPLMLVFKSSNQDFKLALGGSFSYNIGSKVKNKYSINNADYKTTIKGNFNVAPIKFSVGARVAYKWIGLYFNYGLTKMNDKQINGYNDLMPFTAGITLGGL